MIHTNEGDNPVHVYPDRTAENLANYLDRPGVAASYHVIADDDSIVRYLPDNVASWSVRSGNPRSLNLCFTGWARWTRTEWLEHRHMLTLGAVIVRDWCAGYSIPIRKLTPAQVGVDQAGICGHHDWTVGKRDGTHSDPGTGFPWDVFLELIVGDDMSAEAERMIREIHEKVRTPLSNRVDYGFVGEPVPNPRGKDDLFGMAINADARSYEARQVAALALREIREVKALLTVVTDQLSTLQAKRP